MSAWLHSSPFTHSPSLFNCTYWEIQTSSKKKAMAEDPLPQLKNFTLVKKLGTGTYATVYKMVNNVN